MTKKNNDLMQETDPIKLREGVIALASKMRRMNKKSPTYTHRRCIAASILNTLHVRLQKYCQHDKYICTPHDDVYVTLCSFCCLSLVVPHQPSSARMVEEEEMVEKGLECFKELGIVE